MPIVKSMYKKPLLYCGKYYCQKNYLMATAMIAIIVQQIGNIFRRTPSIGTLLITNHLEEFWVGVNKLLLARIR